MKFTWDPQKSRRNHDRHGIPLDAGRLLDWHAALIWVDGRRELQRYVETIEAPDVDGDREGDGAGGAEPGG